MSDAGGLPEISQWVADYVSRARSAGFQCDPTPDGCTYAADADSAEMRMIAKPCDCGCNSWAMFDASPAALSVRTTD